MPVGEKIDSGVSGVVSGGGLPDPYYQDGSVTIYHGDCREIIPELPKVDLIVTDPPYGMGRFKGEVLALAWDYK